MSDQESVDDPGVGAPWTEAERAALAAARQPDEHGTCFLARFAYALGTDPMTYAEDHITALIEVHILAASARLDNPDAYPGYSLELTLEALARRILGELLDAGWTAPVYATANAT